MRIPSHLRRSKDGIFHIRLTVPEILRAQLGRREIKRSLNIRDALSAQHLSVQLSMKFGPRLKEFWDMVKRGKDPDELLTTWQANTVRHDLGYKHTISLGPFSTTVETEPGNEADHRQGMEALAEGAKQLLETLKAVGVSPENLASLGLPPASSKTAPQVDPPPSAQNSSAPPPHGPSFDRSAFSLTLGEAASKYYSFIDANKKVATAKDYKYAVDNFLAFCGRDIKLLDVSDEKINEWVASVREHYRGVAERDYRLRVEARL